MCHTPIQHGQCVFSCPNAIYPLRLSALYINTKSNSPPQCVIPARPALHCKGLVQCTLYTGYQTLSLLYLDAPQCTLTYFYVPRCTLMYLNVPFLCTSMYAGYQTIGPSLRCTSIYIGVPQCASMYLIVPRCAGYQTVEPSLLCTSM